jgi:predicted glycoside hydrolase/deacetylase ChbG (UPF0249 family)
MDSTQLIITGDDFGLSSQVNEAVHRDFEAGLLQQASLVVTGGAVSEAVRIAKHYPDLGVGLHLTLCLGKATERSALTNAERDFADSPSSAGLAYLLRKSLWPSLRREISSQFEHFRALGLGTDYWDGHCHLHLHPRVLDYTLNEAADFRFLRLVQEPRPAHFLGVIFNALSRAARPKVASRGKGVAEVVLGLGHSGRMSTEAFLKCLEKVSFGGLSEIYYHPGAETNSLNVERVSAAIRQRNITLRPVRDLA